MLLLERYRKGKGTFHNSFSREKVQIFLLGSPSAKKNKKLIFKSNEFFIEVSENSLFIPKRTSNIKSISNLSLPQSFKLKLMFLIFTFLATIDHFFFLVIYSNPPSSHTV